MSMVGMQNLEDRKLMAANPFGDLQTTQGPTETLIGLLLPAVQKGPSGGLGLDVDLTNGTPGGGTFLPAVQKVREAASRTNLMPLDLSSGDAGLNPLLLPAVQKVREAASRMQVMETDHVFAAGNENQIIAILIGL